MKSFLLFTGLVLVFFSCSNSRGGEDIGKHDFIHDFENQYQLFLEIQLNQNLNTENQIRNGYFAGFNWNMFRLSGKKQFKTLAEESLVNLDSSLIESSIYLSGKHLMTGYGEGFEATKNDSYQKVLIQAANMLSTNFNQKTGRFNSEKQHPDIISIESVMNLELLFYMAEETGEPVYYNIATRHGKMLIQSSLNNTVKINTEIKHEKHSKKDEHSQFYSEYSTQTDSMKLKSLIITCCAILYEETRELEYLKIAENSVLEFLSELKSANSQSTDQKINESEYDAASLAILASALYDLSWLSGKNIKSYTDKANDIINLLSTNSYFDYENGLINDGNMRNPHAFDKELIRNDIFFEKEYFFLEALMKREEFRKKYTSVAFTYD